MLGSSSLQRTLVPERPDGERTAQVVCAGSAGCELASVYAPVRVRPCVCACARARVCACVNACVGVCIDGGARVGAIAIAIARQDGRGQAQQGAAARFGTVYRR